LKLIAQKPQRLFTFGCSFTDYNWTGWPEIVAYDLQIPLYNYGRIAAGNQYIFNMLMQADANFKFRSNDLIMICWTNVCREDRYIQDHWQLCGNIYTQDFYDQHFIDNCADPLGYLIRDLATIAATDAFLQQRGCQYHHMAMMDIIRRKDQWNPDASMFGTAEQMHTLLKMYGPVLQRIPASYYDVLWNNDLQTKFQIDQQTIHPKFNDGHPLPEEHLSYLQKTYEHDWRPHTITAVVDSQDMLSKHITEQAQKNNIWPWMDCTDIRRLTKIVRSENLQGFC